MQQSFHSILSFTNMLNDTWVILGLDDYVSGGILVSNGVFAEHCYLIFVNLNVFSLICYAPRITRPFAPNIPPLNSLRFIVGK